MSIGHFEPSCCVSFECVLEDNGHVHSWPSTQLGLLPARGLGPRCHLHATVREAGRGSDLMGTLLVVIGLGWALLGVFNLVAGWQQLDRQGFGDTAKGFAVIFNMIILIVPGLGLAGLGQILR